jgi:hypothetical protein
VVILGERESGKGIQVGFKESEIAGVWEVVSLEENESRKE